MCIHSNLKLAYIDHTSRSLPLLDLPSPIDPHHVLDSPLLLDPHQPLNLHILKPHHPYTSYHSQTSHPQTPNTPMVHYHSQTSLAPTPYHPQIPHPFTPSPLAEFCVEVQSLFNGHDHIVLSNSIKQRKISYHYLTQ